MKPATPMNQAIEALKDEVAILRRWAETMVVTTCSCRSCGRMPGRKAISLARSHRVRADSLEQLISALKNVSSRGSDVGGAETNSDHSKGLS